jgi:hypothetical protein
VEEETIKNAILENTYGFLVKPIYKDSLGVTIEFAFTKHLLDKKTRTK